MWQSSVACVHTIRTLSPQVQWWPCMGWCGLTYYRWKLLCLFAGNFWMCHKLILTCICHLLVPGHQGACHAYLNTIFVSVFLQQGSVDAGTL
jgi:hypothetical protein